MSQFTALNVEPDDNQQDDVDNEREVQLEEAIKLYQTALRLHSQISQGPEAFAQAVDAYDKLLDHQVFKFPDSITEYERFEKFGDTDIAIHHGLDAGVIQASDKLNSLPQILYLAYKNHGLLLMDSLKYRHLNGELLQAADIRSVARRALDDFAKALARDESDTELWRRSARVATILGSHRIARYCLEAALEVDDDPTQAQVEPVNLEEGFAGALLKEHLEVLEDEVALSHPIMTPYQQNVLPDCTKRFLDPYPFLQQCYMADETPNVSSVRLDVEVSDKSWQALGASLLQADLASPGSCRAIHLTITSSDQDMIDADVTQTLPAQMSPPEGQDHVAELDEVEGVVDAQRHSGSVENNIPDSITAAELETPPDATASNTGREFDLPDRKRAEDGGDASRKRSLSAVKDGVEDDNLAQKRPRRMRNRDAVGAEALPVDPDAIFRERLAYYKEIDTVMFDYINTLLVKLHLPQLDSIDSLLVAADRKISPQDPCSLRESLMCDLQSIFEHWSDVHTTSYLNGTAANLLVPASAGPIAGLSTFLDHLHTDSAAKTTKDRIDPANGFPRFVNKINSNWMPLQVVVYEYFSILTESYMTLTWSEDMKFNTLQLLVQFDATMYNRIVEMSENALLTGGGITKEVTYLGQMLFELHLDLYVQISGPSSGVPQTIVDDQQLRLPRWAILATKIAHYHNETGLTIRYLWSSALFLSVCPEAKDRPDYIVSSWNDMKRALHVADTPDITIANNAAMPELSCAAADRQITKITSTDFFNRLISSDQGDPVTLIETLEPVLIPGSYQDVALAPVEDHGTASKDVNNTTGPLQANEDVQNMWKLLEGGSAGLHLFLWQRLREAYQHPTINYKTKVFSCHLKSIEVIVGDLLTPNFQQHSQAARQKSILGWLKTLDDLLVKSLTMALNDSTAFDIIDEPHTRSTCTALVELCLLLHSAAIYDDRIRIGAIIPKIKHGAKAWDQLWHRLREMQIRAWALLYTLLKDAMSQNKDAFPNMDSDLADCLSVIHVQLGARKQCKASNKIFLKMMKVEMLRLKHVDKWSDYMGQILYDLYGLKLGTGIYVLGEHDCPTENLEKRTALQISDKIIELANLMSVKDLLKSELRQTIETMQKAISNHKPEQTADIKHNERIIRNYLKGSLHPRDFHNANKGSLNISTIPVRDPSDNKLSERTLGQSKWYFLLGVMALTRFKTQKRLVPGAATDDLRVALTLLQTQLQHTPDSWEVWYRLGQCFDAELEESVIFSADKLNTIEDRKDIAGYQRRALRCYLLAYSLAFQHAEDDLVTAGKLGDLYHDLGLRLYSSSREPFSMEAFYLDEFPRHFCSAGGKMYIDHAHPEYRRAETWQGAAVLFKKAIASNSRFWFNHYMYGKCLWKLFTKGPRTGRRPAVEEVLHAFEMAIEYCPKISSSSSKDPILEPHYKYISVMHKLVLCGEITMQDATDKLQAQQYTHDRGAKVLTESFEDWKLFVLDRIRAVQHADKSSWHHRIIFRLARIIHDDQTEDVDSAREAYACLMKAMFTKTMVVNVWKPEFERLGRHCVYGENYIRYMIHLLMLLDEREQMLQLCRRVRKRQADYFHFQQLWEACVEGTCALFRRAVPDLSTNTEQELLNMDPDTFRTISDKLKECVDQDTAMLPRSAALYKDIDELKRLNMQGPLTLLKTTSMDDLIIDIYSSIFKDVGMAIAITTPTSQVPSPQPVDTTKIVATITHDPRPHGPMSITSMLAAVDSPSPIPSQEEQRVVSATDLATESIIPSIEKETIARPSKPLAKREILKRAELLMKNLNLTTSLATVTQAQPSPSKNVGDEAAEAAADAAQTADDEVASPRTSERQVEYVEDKSNERVEIHDATNEPMRNGSWHDQGNLSPNTPVAEEQKELEAVDGEDSIAGSVHDSADDESDGSESGEEDGDGDDAGGDENRRDGFSAHAGPPVEEDADVNEPGVGNSSRRVGFLTETTGY